MKRGKKYIEAAKLIERGNLYDPAEAVALVKKSATAKFDETIEAHIRTRTLRLRKQRQQVLTSLEETN